MVAPLPLVAQEKNLALGAVATASSSESARYEPSKAVDGKAASGWASGAGDPQWIVVDLGTLQRVGRIVLNWGIASAKDYRLEASRNGKSWKPIADRSGTAAGIREDDFPSLKTKARYLRVLCVARAKGADQYTLREL